VFFANCNLACMFCQNYELSHLGHGREAGYEDLARAMLALQDRGCHNINLVSPTHMLHAIVQALLIAIPLGLRLPLVYNSGGYDAADVLGLLEGVFDIYMPDFKYGEAGTGRRLSGVADYPERAREAVGEMHRQVGDLRLDERGVAVRGLLVRHLVLPEGLAGTRQVMRFLAGLSPHTCVNVMGQYYPAYRAREHTAMGRRPTPAEVDEAAALAREAGLRRVLR
jgi:putative pyruvate formate lyase activating enzyme